MRLDVADRLAVTWAALDERPRTAEDVHRRVLAIGDGGEAYLRARHELASRLIPVARHCKLGQVRAALDRHVRMGQVVLVADARPRLYRRIDPAALLALHLRRLLAQADEEHMPVLEIPYMNLPGLKVLRLSEHRVAVDSGGLRRWLDFHFPEAA